MVSFFVYEFNFSLVWLRLCYLFFTKLQSLTLMFTEARLGWLIHSSVCPVRRMNGFVKLNRQGLWKWIIVCKSCKRRNMMVTVLQFERVPCCRVWVCWSLDWNVWDKWKVCVHCFFFFWIIRVLQIVWDSKERKLLQWLISVIVINLGLEMVF